MREERVTLCESHVSPLFSLLSFSWDSLMRESDRQTDNTKKWKEDGNANVNHWWWRVQKGMKSSTEEDPILFILFRLKPSAILYQKRQLHWQRRQRRVRVKKRDLISLIVILCNSLFVQTTETSEEKRNWGTRTRNKCRVSFCGETRDIEMTAKENMLCVWPLIPWKWNEEKRIHLPVICFSHFFWQWKPWYFFRYFLRYFLRRKENQAGSNSHKNLCHVSNIRLPFFLTILDKVIRLSLESVVTENSFDRNATRSWFANVSWLKEGLSSRNHSIESSMYFLPKEVSQNIL